MSTINSENILSVLREEITNYRPSNEARQRGYVLACGDGVATVYGLPTAMYGELVTFENGQAGMVLNLSERDMGVLLLGADQGVREGAADEGHQPGQDDDQVAFLQGDRRRALHEDEGEDADGESDDETDDEGRQRAVVAVQDGDDDREEHKKRTHEERISHVSADGFDVHH